MIDPHTPNKRIEELKRFYRELVEMSKDSKSFLVFELLVYDIGKLMELPMDNPYVRRAIMGNGSDLTKNYTVRKLSIKRENSTGQK